MIRDNLRSKAKVQARGLLGGQGLDYCQTRTDTIQATCHVQAYRNTYQHFSNRVKVKYFDRPIIRKPPIHRHLQNKATICAHDTLFKKIPPTCHLNADVGEHISVTFWTGCWRARELRTHCILCACYAPTKQVVCKDPSS